MDHQGRISDLSGQLGSSRATTDRAVASLANLRSEIAVIREMLLSGPLVDARHFVADLLGAALDRCEGFDPSAVDASETLLAARAELTNEMLSVNARYMSTTERALGYVDGLDFARKLLTS